MEIGSKTLNSDLAHIKKFGIHCADFKHEIDHIFSELYCVDRKGFASPIHG